MLKLLLIFLSGSLLTAQDQLRIGSKRFTESYILGEILNQTALQTGEGKVEYKEGLGNTGIVFHALQEGAIDLYPEYTGTISQEILKQPALNLEDLNQKLAPLGLGVAIPFGFMNTYALAMREEMAERLHIRSISDLKKFPSLKLGFSQEFLQRTDGYEALKKTYQLPFQKPLGIDHSLCYEALSIEQIDLMDVYSTDPKIETLHLCVLEDDLHFFPRYEACVLYRLDVPNRFPQTWARFLTLSNSFSEEKMRSLNGRAELSSESFVSIAQSFLSHSEISRTSSSFWNNMFEHNFWLLVVQHLLLVIGSLIPAIVIGFVLGLCAAYVPRFSGPILHSVGVIQTIPSLALLAFLIPLLHQIGMFPALVALFLYALLPIVRNTYTGLISIPQPLRESALVLALPAFVRLIYIEIPLASRTILAGIKTAAVMNVGMATIAALIGAGGLGDRIITGLALNNTEILLSGAIPACILAVLVQWFFDALDFWVVPEGIKK